MITCRAIARLLSYPDAELQAHMHELKAAIASEDLVSHRLQKKLFLFMDTLAATDLIDAQEDYISLFDRGRAHSLYLFEHVHGDSRLRGQAMVDLRQQYGDHGLVPAEHELPDYLPLFLEYVSILPPLEAQDNLAEIVHILAAVGAKLKRKDSPYTLAFEAITQLSTAKVDEDFVKKALREDDERDESIEAIDREWAETPAFDGLGDMADCNGCDQINLNPVQAPGQKEGIVA
jgi:nitrate reductase delta subunit